MSSAAILILSLPAVALQTRCFLSPAVVAKECWWCNTEVERGHHQASTSFNLKAVGRFQSDGSIRANRSTAAKAGLGRFSGAIHGNSKRKSGSRRRPPVQEDDDPERCDEHQESISGSDDTLTTHSPEKSGESSAEEDAASEAFAAAEGIISEDASSDDGSQQLSYNRYLLEMGVSPRTLSGDFPDDNAVHLSEEQHLPDDGVLSQTGIGSGGGQGGHPGGEITEELKSERAKDASRSRGNLGEKLDFVLEHETKSESESISLDGTSPTVSPSPDDVLEPSSSIEGENKGFESGGQTTDGVADAENTKELRSATDDGPIKKKRRRKLKSKAAVDSSLPSEERGDNERVRASSGGAERPSMPSDEGLEKIPAMNGSVTAVKEIESFESKVDMGTGEAPEKVPSIEKEPSVEKEPSIESSLAFSPVAESIDVRGQSSIALDGAVVSNSTSDVSNEDTSPQASKEDTPLSVLGKAGPAMISVPSVAAADETEGLMLSRIETVVGEQPGQVGSQVVETVLEQAVQTAVKVVPLELVEQAALVASKVVELPVVVVEQAAQVGGQVIENLPDVVSEQVGQVVDQVSDFAEQVSGQVVDQVSDFAEQVSQEVSQVVDHVSDVAEQVANTVNEQVEIVAESVSSTASQVAEQVTNSVDTVTSTASQVVDQVAEFFSSDDEADSDSDDEFEAYITSDLPEFRGRLGLSNFIVKQEDQGVLSKIYDLYTYMLKQSFPKFAVAMFCTPILVSALFTLLYLPEFDGLAFDETARDFFQTDGGDSLTLQISWNTIFQVFMFSLSLSTGLQPELSPLSPYTLIVANLNALVAQLVFVFLSGAVFARLSQPSQPLRCSSVALVSASPAQRRRKENSIKVFMARYVLAGPQPCELVDVKVDLTYKYNTLTRTGSFFRATQSLKLVRPEIAFLTHGMLVRHVIDETSPLYQRTSEMLDKEDAVFCLSVVGLERASMQSVFHVQHYCVVDNDVVWDAEFEDMILINKKNRRVVDHSMLSMWRPVIDIQPLRLVTPEFAFLTHGMLVRHVVDENSPLYRRTAEELSKEDGVFCLSVFGVERASMQSVSHVQHYCVVDNDVIWDAEFEDMVMINKKNQRIVDHARLSLWRPLNG